MHSKSELDFLNLIIILFMAFFMYSDGLKDHNVRYTHTHEL